MAFWRSLLAAVLPVISALGCAGTGVRSAPARSSATPAAPVPVASAAAAIAPPRPQDPNAPRLVVQTGHRASVTAVAGDAKGRWLVSASRDQTVKIWDRKTERELRTLLGHAKEVTDVAVADARGLVVSASNDGTIRFWELETGKPVRTIVVKNKSDSPIDVRKIAITPDAGTIVAARADAMLTILTPSGEAAVKAGHHLSALAMTADARRAVAGTTDGKLVVIDVRKATVEREIDVHTGTVDSVVVTPDDLVISTGRDKHVRVHRLDDGRRVRELDGAFEITTLAFDVATKQVIGADRLAHLHVWNLATGAAVKEHRWSSLRPGSGIATIYLPPGTRDAFLGLNEGIAHWKLGTETLRELDRSGGFGFQAALSSDGKTFVVNDGALRLYELESARLLTVANVGFNVARIQYLPNAGAGRVAFVVADTMGGVTLHRDGHQTPLGTRGGLVATFAISSDGSRVAVANGQSVTVHRTSDGTQESTLQLPGGPGMFPPACMAFSPDGAHVLAANLAMMTSDLRLMRVSDGAVAATYAPPPGEPGLPALPEAYGACAISGDGAKVLASNASGDIRVFDRASGRLTGTLAGHALPASALAPLGPTRLLTGGDDGLVIEWDLATLAAVRRYRGHTGGVLQVMPEADGKHFLSVASDHTIRYWALAYERPYLTVAPVTLDDDRAATLAFDDEGYFDFDDRAALRLLHAVHGQDVIRLNQLIELFYRPGLARAIRTGKPLARTVDLSAGFRMPPELTLAAASAGASIRASVDVKVREGGATRLALFRNGRVVGDQAIDKGGSYSFDVAPNRGQNVVRAVAWSADGVKTYSDDVVLAPVAPNPPRLGKTHVLAVGIDDYGAKQRVKARGGTEAVLRGTQRVGDLDFAVADANAFAARFRPPPTFMPGEVVTITNAAATREGILAALARIAANAREEDAVVAYFSGHGFALPRQRGRVSTNTYYFVPSDYGSLADVVGKSLSSEDLFWALARIPARPITLLLDTCQSGAANEMLTNDVLGTMRALGEDAGIHVFAAAASTQSALELPDLRHGLFTGAALEALACHGEPLSFTAFARATSARMNTLLGVKDAQSTVISTTGDDPPFARCDP